MVKLPPFLVWTGSDSSRLALWNILCQHFFFKVHFIFLSLIDFYSSCWSDPRNWITGCSSHNSTFQPEVSHLGYFEYLNSLVNYLCISSLVTFSLQTKTSVYIRQHKCLCTFIYTRRRKCHVSLYINISTINLAHRLPSWWGCGKQAGQLGLAPQALQSSRPWRSRCSLLPLQGPGGCLDYGSRNIWSSES